MTQIAAIIVSFLISNWIYAELILFFPAVDPYFKRMVAVVRIPTHDEWSPILKSQEGKQLKKQLATYTQAPSLKPIFKSIGILDKDIQAMVVRSGVFGTYESDCNAQQKCSYLKDEAMFSHRTESFDERMISF